MPYIWPHAGSIRPRTIPSALLSDFPGDFLTTASPNRLHFSRAQGVITTPYWVNQWLMQQHSCTCLKCFGMFFQMFHIGKRFWSLWSSMDMRDICTGNGFLSVVFLLCRPELLKVTNVDTWTLLIIRQTQQQLLNECRPDRLHWSVF